MIASPLSAMQEELDQAVERFEPELEIDYRPMFGGICAYASGRVFASLSDVGLAIKLAQPDQTELLSVSGAKRLRYEPDAPESKQYIVAPQALRSDPAELAVWLGRSIQYVRSLPAPKPRRGKQ